MKKKTILLIEDSQDDIAFTQRAFNRNDHDIILLKATTTQTVLEILNNQKYTSSQPFPPDLILIDIDINFANGLEILKTIRQDKRFQLIPIVVFSSSQNQKDIYRAIQNGANSYIQKPLTYKRYEMVIDQIAHYWFDIHRLTTL